MDIELCPTRHEVEPMQVDEETMEWNDQDNVNTFVSLMEED